MGYYIVDVKYINAMKLHYLHPYIGFYIKDVKYINAVGTIL